MNYKLIKDVLDLVEEFDLKTNGHKDIDAFKNWIAIGQGHESKPMDPDWEGKDKGRSAESAISTLLVHLNRYAKSYSRSAMFGSLFTSQEDFIYLINLKAFGAMTKMELIKKNVHEKPVGMQIINRLISQGWVDQRDSETDKRSKELKINNDGLSVLDKQMDKIRQATMVVAGDLTHAEKMELIRILNKLNDFHQPIYEQHIQPQDLLDEVVKMKDE